MSPEALSDVHSLFDSDFGDLNDIVATLQRHVAKWGADVEPKMADRVWASLSELNVALLRMGCDRCGDHMACVPYNGVLICTDCAEQLAYVPGPDLDRAYDDSVGR